MTWTNIVAVLVIVAVSWFLCVKCRRSKDRADCVRTGGLAEGSASAWGNWGSLALLATPQLRVCATALRLYNQSQSELKNASLVANFIGETEAQRN